MNSLPARQPSSFLARPMVRSRPVVLGNSAFLRIRAARRLKRNDSSVVEPLVFKPMKGPAGDSDRVDRSSLPLPA